MLIREGEHHRPDLFPVDLSYEKGSARQAHARVKGDEMAFVRYRYIYYVETGARRRVDDRVLDAHTPPVSPTDS